MSEKSIYEEIIGGLSEAIEDSRCAKKTLQRDVMTIASEKESDNDALQERWQKKQ